MKNNLESYEWKNFIIDSINQPENTEQPTLKILTF